MSRPPSVAVLWQAAEPPFIRGAKKPMKPGGYRDSGSDIAYVLKEKCRVSVVTPSPHPDPGDVDAWCFPDHEEGILSAIGAGANLLWANTVLHGCHPLQASTALRPHLDSVRVVGQPPWVAETCDDKSYVLGLLRETGGFTIPASGIVRRGEWGDDDGDDEKLRAALNRPGVRGWPLVAKPVRGRGSHGVRLCASLGELRRHLDGLFGESSAAIVEEFLAGDEATVTVMPPCAGRPTHWAMPTVMRFNHVDGVAPYSGVVAVTANSRVLTPEEEAADGSFARVRAECAAAGRLLGTTAPIRIDVRRRERGGDFALFDINTKPNMTGPGRPGREDQASLTAMAASALGWDYPKLLESILSSAVMLRELRGRRGPRRRQVDRM